MPATLLLADDSVTIQRVIELTFANEDVRVIAVGDGQAALQRIEAERPDIVLADVGMPKLDGYGVAAHIKQSPELRDIPVLLLTGAFEPVDEDRARATGCDGILVKPFEPQQLVGRVKELLAGRRSPALWPTDLPRVDPVAAPKPASDLPWPPAPEPVALPPLAGPVAESEYALEFDQLDVAFVELDPAAGSIGLDESLTSGGAPDLDPLHSGAASLVPPPARTFGDWDIPSTRSDEDRVDLSGLTLPQPAPAPFGSAALRPGPASATSGRWDLPVGSPPPVAPTPESTVAGPGLGAPAPTSAAPVFASTGPAGPKLTIASAFSALLAAEQTVPPTHPTAPAEAISEGVVEEMVRRAIARMTDETVKKTVLDVAERLIREEIEKIKAVPDEG